MGSLGEAVGSGSERVLEGLEGGEEGEGEGNEEEYGKMGGVGDGGAGKREAGGKGERKTHLLRFCRLGCCGIVGGGSGN